MTKKDRELRDDPDRQPTKDDMVDALLTPFQKRLDEKGITDDFLIDKLNAEFRAGEVKAFKSDSKTSDGKNEIIYTKNMTAWNIRQKARMDAQKLKGHYPEEGIRVVGSVSTSLSKEDRDLLEEAAKGHADAIINQHLKDISGGDREPEEG